MFKQSLFALAATGSVFAAAAPDSAEARQHRSSLYDSRGRYIQPRAVSRNQVWRGNDGRYYCRRQNGTVGLVLGAAGGALVGRAIDTHGDRAVGTIVGAAAGALLGREAEKQIRCQ
jgi:outer membrane lipoprotein SlyB